MGLLREQPGVFQKTVKGKGATWLIASLCESTQKQQQQQHQLGLTTEDKGKKLKEREKEKESNRKEQQVLAPPGPLELAPPRGTPREIVPTGYAAAGWSDPAAASTRAGVQRANGDPERTR